MVETIVFVVIITMLMGFIVYKDYKHTKQVDVLTSKLMARDYHDYAVNKPLAERETRLTQEKEKTSKISDPVLGTNF